MIRLAVFVLAALLDLVPGGEAFLRPLQKRDSILVADHLEYGFQLDSVQRGTVLALPDFEALSNDTLTLVRGWQIDTLKAPRRQSWRSIRAHVVIAPFEEGVYQLPPMPVLREVDGRADPLLFAAQQMEVKTMPVDTATFQPHDLKGQIGYPVTFRELLPWLLGGLLLAGLVALAVVLIARHRKAAVQAPPEPAHIVALRRLETYRNQKYWAPDHQKAFYSGVTDTLKNYMGARFGVDAPEMTTAELFAALHDEKDIPGGLYEEMKDLFERADFVKFAKHIASDEENAAVLPLGVRFVTTTYQSQLEEEQKNNDEL